METLLLTVQIVNLAVCRQKTVFHFPHCTVKDFIALWFVHWEGNSEGKILESRNWKVQKCRKCKMLNPIKELFKNTENQKFKNAKLKYKENICGIWESVK